MEDAMANLTGIHVLLVMQYEEEMSHFHFGLCRQTLNGSLAPLHSCCLTSCQAPANKR